MIDYFIAGRYLRVRHKISFITIISFLSTAGITIGVAALIVVLSVFNGFGAVVTSILVSFDPHLRISVTDEKGFDQIDSVGNFLKQQADVESFYPFVESKVIAVNKNSYEILNLKGLTPEFADGNWGVSTKIISGNFNIDSGGTTNRIIIGLPIALRLSARVGDTIYVTSAHNIEKTITTFAIPQTRRFIVSGIFESNNRDYDIGNTFTSLRSGQELFGLHGKISGYEVRLKNISDAENLKEALYARFGGDFFSFNTWYDLHKELYNVMLIERWAAYILLCLIIAVASFNIFASLTMTVIEKKKDIGVLRSIGVKKKTVVRIFMFEGLLVGVIGTAAGLVIGLLVCYLQIEYKFYPLDPAKYIIDAMPVQVRMTDIIAVSAMAIFLAFIASLYPARRAANTNIIDAIKYE